MNPHDLGVAQRTLPTRRRQLPHDELEQTERKEPSCETLAATGAAGLGHEAAQCERPALARFDGDGLMPAQTTLSSQRCRAGATQVQLRDFSGHGSDELVLVASWGAWGATGRPTKGTRSRSLASASWSSTWSSAGEAFAPHFELDLAERETSDTPNTPVERRVRVSPTGWRSSPR